MRFPKDTAYVSKNNVRYSLGGYNVEFLNTGSSPVTEIQEQLVEHFSCKGMLG